MNRTLATMLAMLFVFGVSVVVSKAWAPDSWLSIIGGALLVGASAGGAIAVRNRVSQ